MKKIIIVCSVLFLYSCLKVESFRVIIINNSNENILWHICDIESYPNNPWITAANGKVLSTMEDVKKDNAYIAAGDSVVDVVHKYGYFPRVYYFYNYDSVCNIPWQRIKDDSIYLKKVTFYSWEEMEQCNYTITYP